MKHKESHHPKWWLCFGIAFVSLFACGLVAHGIITVPKTIDTLHSPQAEHVSQKELRDLVADGQAHKAFELAFELGDELFEVSFNALDGVGANVGQGQRFTRVPRADLDGPGEWANHFPTRATGPNAQACNDCHNRPFNDGAGAAASNNIRDPLHEGKLASFINRQPPHLMAIGAVQRLAEEMTDELHAIRDRTVADAVADEANVTNSLDAKGVHFGSIIAHSDGKVDTSAVEGVNEDLVVRPFDWKGVFATIRSFNRDAAHNELGMQPVETVGDGQDGDFDGVVDEMTVGDMTALAVYNAAQPRPTTRIELANLGLIDPLSPQEVNVIENGKQVFEEIGCASCHMPSFTLDDRIFSEPSQNPSYRDDVFPAGQDPVSRGVEPAFPVTFDLTQDQPDNHIMDAQGNVIFNLGALEMDDSGNAIVRLFGDLKRHDMGPGLAETIDAAETGASVFLTENLWGVSSTAPYLHDGRATTLTEAILEHGGEAASSRDAFVGLAAPMQESLIAFLNNLVLFKMEEEEEE